MNPAPPPPTEPGKSALQLLQDINAGVIDANVLDKHSRQACLELLMAEEYTQAQMAQVFKCADRTIRRDLEEIRARHALTPNAALAKELIGLMYHKALNHHGYLARLARLKETPAAEKIQAEFAAWRVLRELIERMQTLGYLPRQAEHLALTLTEGVEESYAEMAQQLLAMERLAQACGTLSPAVAHDITRLKCRLEKGQLQEATLALIAQHQQPKEQAGETSDAPKHHNNDRA